MQLFDAVVTERFGVLMIQTGDVQDWGCALEVREDLGMQLGLGFCEYQFGYRVLEHVLLDQSDMYLGPAISFALGLYVVTLSGWKPCQPMVLGIYVD